MRYRGGGVGHLATRQCNEVLLADKHTPFVENSSTPAAHMGPGDQFGETDEEHAEDEDEAGDDTEEDNDDQLAGARHDADIVAVAGFAAL
jgi:hypothetical protein